MADFVRETGYGILVVQTEDGLGAAHLPYVLDGADRLRFHIARRNRITPHLDGARGLFIVNGPSGYISPDWYGLAQQVPTWNYAAVELDGVIGTLGVAALRGQLDDASAAHEAHLAPKAPWTADQLSPQRMAALMDAIHGFEFRITGWRGTLKMGQGKPRAALAATANGVSAAGNEALARMIRKQEGKQ